MIKKLKGQHQKLKGQDQKSLRDKIKKAKWTKFKKLKEQDQKS